MLPAVLLAAACATWHPAVLGYYPGTVANNGDMHPIDAWITESSEGRLEGHYVLHEPTRNVPGTLASVGDTTCDTSLFQWTDLYGTGLVELHFYPDRKCFEGNWGAETPLPQLPWHACTRDKPTS